MGNFFMLSGGRKRGKKRGAPRSAKKKEKREREKRERREEIITGPHRRHYVLIINKQLNIVRMPRTYETVRERTANAHPQNITSLFGRQMNGNNQPPVVDNNDDDVMMGL